MPSAAAPRSRVRFSTLVALLLPLLASTATPASAQSLFIRGDANSDGLVDLADPVRTLSFLFSNDSVDCLAALDSDDSGDLTIGDAIVTLSFLFSNGPAPAAPFPDCGLDPTPDSLSCDGPVGACSIPVSIANPTPGAVIGSGLVDVAGTLGVTAPSFEVRVNGVLAELTPDSTESTFIARNVPVTPGLNTLIAEVSAGGSALETAEVTITHTPLNANNLALMNGIAYAALGSAGVAVLQTDTREFTVVSPAPGSGSVDDVAVADGFLFTLDAAGPGSLSVYSLSDPLSPALVSGPVAVAVGPFAGVSAAGGRVVVSGGTGLVTLRSYSVAGVLSAQSSSIDLGIGQPDVLLSADGSLGFFSTDFSGFIGGSSFGITTVSLATPPGSLTILDQIGLPGAGFSGGFLSPANFPIESALLPGGGLVTAHGGGLSSIDGNSGSLLTTLGLPFAAVNVDTVGTTAFVVGTGRSLAEVDLANPSAPAVQANVTFPGGGSFVSVAADAEVVILGASVGGLLVMSR